MKQETQYIIVVANSVRMLAKAAKKAGFKPLSIDLYGDQDAVFCSEDHLKIPSLQKVHLTAAVRYFRNRYPVTHSVYGSGFEQYPDSLSVLSDDLILVGNQPEVFAKSQDKATFFSLLSALGIPFPQVAFNVPDVEKDWLIKPMRGHGGYGIKKFRNNEVGSSLSSVYWQKYQQGEPHSVLFLANGEKCQIIGFNKQWTTALNNKNEFVFSGIVNHTVLTCRQKSRLITWIEKLVAAFSLKGLNSLDFIQHGEESYVLEINHRPPASMQLYGADLFVRHLKACEGELDDLEQTHDDITGYQVVYARQGLTIPRDFKWPEDTFDLPKANTIISAGQPICSMITHAQKPLAVHEQLSKQQAFILNELNRFQTHGI